MIKHIVFFNFLDEADGCDKAGNIERAKAMLDGLPGKVPTLRSMVCGPNAVPGATAWDFALIAEFDDEQGLREYVDHPEHRKVTAFMGKVRAGRASVDIRC